MLCVRRLRFRRRGLAASAFRLETVIADDWIGHSLGKCFYLREQRLWEFVLVNAVYDVIEHFAGLEPQITWSGHAWAAFVLRLRFYVL